MAKKQKSKLLAMALCASVMTGIYASPVMAANVSIWQDTTDNKIDFGLDDGKNNSVPVIRFDYNGMTVYNGSGTWDVFGISRHDGDFYAANKHFRVAKDGSISLNPTSDANTNPTIKLDAASGAIKAATGKFNVDSYGNTEAANFTGTEFNVTGQNDEVVSYLRAGDLRINDFSSWNSSGLTVGDFKISKNNSNYIVELKQHGGDSVFKADGAAGTVEAAGVKFESNNIALADEATVDGVDVSELETKFNTTNANVAGITRNDEGTATTIEGKTVINADGSFSTASGAFQVDAEGNVLAGTVNGYNVAEIGYTVNQIAPNVAGIERVGETTTIEKDFAVNGVNNTFGSANGSFIVNTEDGSFNAADGNFNVAPDGVVTANDFVSSGNYTLNTVGEQLAALEGEFGATNANVAGIERNGETTTIESDFAVNGANNTFGSANNSFVVNTEDGSFMAANGSFMVDGTGTVYSEKAVIAGGAVTLENGEGTTSIKGGTITTDSLNVDEINGVAFGDFVQASDVENVAGIDRTDYDGDGIYTTEIEQALKVSKNEYKLAYENAYMTMDDNGTTFGGKLTFKDGHDVEFTYGKYGDTTNLGDLAVNVDNLLTDVAELQEKTTGITYDKETGATTITDQVGTDGVQSNNSLAVGNDGITMNGNTVVNGSNTTAGGDGTVPGVGDADVAHTVNGDQLINGDQHVTGNSQFDGSATFGSTDGNQTKINGGTVTVDNSVTVGGTTSITGSGMTVGNTSVTGSDVTINKGTENEISLSDVGNVGILHEEIKNATGETTVVDAVNNEYEQRVAADNALNQRVDALNSRVDKLDDRIDKVGAMAAAIANLRTMGYDPAAPTEVAVGLGQYRDETGAALGLFHYPNRDFMLSLSVSTSGDEVMGGIGATWKFGRKSPEKVAEIKKAQAEADVRRAEAQKLAKAEELKAAAKEAKIKAQMERHAKLAAERAAEAEAK